MIVDANILIYARDASSRDHDAARAWLEPALNGSLRIGLPWESLGAFLRVITNPRASANPLTPEQATDQVRGWLAAPAAWVPTPTDRHAEVFLGLLDHYGRGANLVPDAQLASIAICHGVGICSADSDFARFEQLRWFNPLT